MYAFEIYSFVVKGISLDNDLKFAEKLFFVRVFAHVQFYQNSNLLIVTKLGFIVRKIERISQNIVHFLIVEFF